MTRTTVAANSVTTVSVAPARITISGSNLPHDRPSTVTIISAQAVHAARSGSRQQKPSTTG